MMTILDSDRLKTIVELILLKTINIKTAEMKQKQLKLEVDNIIHLIQKIRQKHRKKKSKYFTFKEFRYIHLINLNSLLYC